jgi:hypothetical protein
VHGNKVLGTISRFTGLYSAPLEILALLTVIWALVRRDRTILALAGGVVVWVVVEIAFVLHGWPGIARYMFEAAGVMIVIAGVGFGRLIADGRAVSRGAGVAGLIVALAFAGALVPTAVSRARVERTDLATQRKRTAEINRLTGTIRSLGGAARLRACGEPLTRLEYQTMLAWQIGENVSRIGFKYSQAVARGDPIMLFTPEPDGWKVEALHQTAAACRSLPR